MKGEKKKRLIRVGVILLGLGGAFFIFLLLRPPCLIRATTGLYCAGCGGSRMIAAVLEGDFLLAFRQNPLLFVAFPLLGAYAVGEAACYVEQKSPLWKRRWVQVAMALLAAASLVFTLLRNLPGLDILRPY